MKFLEYTLGTTFLGITIALMSLTWYIITEGLKTCQ